MAKVSLRDVRKSYGNLEVIHGVSIDIEAFRCTIPELGYTVWVTARGGVIKFDTGRGLSGLLER